jgi:hypothetical protein|tara:strand:- start:752 stop:1192 length:441 start_codon:yes stop_codon:yes gene_type:complete
MRKLINLDLDNWKRYILKDDPVRPHLDMDWRLEDGRQAYALEDEDGKMASVVCVAFTNGIAITEEGLENTTNPDTVMFYTVWSYSKNAGRDIIFAAAGAIKRDYPHIKRFVTLSPLTDAAERFHLRNGAAFLAKGDLCQNFEYTQI